VLHEEIVSHVSVMQTLVSIQDRIEQTVSLLVEAIGQGNKMLVCGNGGSAADVQHFAA